MVPGTPFASTASESPRDLGSVLLVLANAALIALWAAWAWSAYASLPDRIPTHFALGGMPDAWGGKTIFTWFLLPGTAVFISIVDTAAALAVTMAMRRWPQAINLPRKAEYLALPFELRQRVEWRLRRTLLAMALFLSLGLFGIHRAIWDATRSGRAQLNETFFLVVMAAMIGAMVLGFAWFLIGYYRILGRSDRHGSR